MTQTEILNKCTVKGNIVFLPDTQLDRKVYLGVANTLNHIGGNWKRKENGFVFPSDPTDLLKNIQKGEKRNIKKELQFFETPDSLADEMVKVALVQTDHKVLEPSAGRGSIVRALNRQDIFDIDCFEIDKTNILLFQGRRNHINECDFLQVKNHYNTYDRIVANPPFSKNQDIKHIKRMYDMCKPGGRIVSLASPHYTFCNNTVESEFRDWLEQICAEIIPLAPGRFKESGTNIQAHMIVIDK